MIPYFNWKFFTAVKVALPNLVVSYPEDPTPVKATFVSALEFKTICRYLTSINVIPNFRLVWKVKVAGTAERPVVEPVPVPVVPPVVVPVVPPVCIAAIS